MSRRSPAAVPGHARDAAPPAADGADGADGAFTHRQVLTVLAGLMAAMFLAALDRLHCFHPDLIRSFAIVGMKCV